MPSYRGAQISFMPPLAGMVKALVVVTSAVFLLTYLPAQFLNWQLPYLVFGLTPYSVTHNFWVWQLGTYLFLHGGWFHIIFNLFALWMFGADIERAWGPRRFLFYFFLTGIGAGLLSVILQPSSFLMTIGNSGAVYGVLLAYGMLFPDRPIFLWFVIPIKAKWFVLIWGLIEFWASITQPGSGVAHVAHLGGMLFGYVYLRTLPQGRGGKLGFNFRGQYEDWRRARLRRKFDLYMQKRDPKDPDQWIN